MRGTARLSLILACLLTSAACAATAAARAHPKVTFSFTPSEVEAGQPIAIAYRALHVPAGAHLEFQRAVGTRGVWRRVTTLALTGSSTANLPAATQGVKPYKLALVFRHHTLASATRTLRVYNTDSLASVTSRTTDTVQINGSLFRYLREADPLFDGGDYCFLDVKCTAGTQLSAFKVTKSSCRSVSLEIGDLVSEGTAEPPTVTIVSEAADPTSTRVPLNATTTMTGDVVGDFEVDLAYQPVGSGTEDRAYFNGTADCYTASGST